MINVELMDNSACVCNRPVVSVAEEQRYLLVKGCN